MLLLLLVFINLPIRFMEKAVFMKMQSNNQKKKLYLSNYSYFTDCPIMTKASVSRGGIPVI